MCFYKYNFFASHLLHLLNMNVLVAYPLGMQLNFCLWKSIATEVPVLNQLRLWNPYHFSGLESMVKLKLNSWATDKAETTWISVEVHQGFPCQSFLYFIYGPNTDSLFHKTFYFTKKVCT